MATWDGSYSGPDDKNYYMYSDQNIPRQTAENWSYVPNNVSDGYLQSGHEYYAQNQSVFEQNCQPLYQMEDYPSNVPAIPENGGINNYHEQLVSNTMNNAQVPNNYEYFPNPNKPQQCFIPTRWNGNYNRKPNRNTKRVSLNEVGIDRSQIAGHSNLHVTASEFVPNNRKHNKERSKPQKMVTPTGNNPDYYGKDVASQSGTSDNYSFYDRNKYDRRYDKRRGTNYRQREEQRGQSQKGNVYKNSYRQQSRGKFQGDRYPSNRYRSDKQETGGAAATSNKSTMEKPYDSDACVIQDSNVFEVNTVRKDSFSHRNIKGDADLLIDEPSDKGISGNRDNSQQNNKGKKYNYSKEFVGSNVRQQQGQRNTRKYSFNAKPDRGENHYKDSRYNYQEHNREYYSKENKIDACKEKEKSRSMTFESKVRGTENRFKKEVYERNPTLRRGQNKKPLFDNDASQRERLTNQLNKGQLECLVCCEYIKQNDYVWSCSNCCHVLHLECIQKWAESSQSENGWRCPACQNVNLTVPEDYFCFCGKMRTPEWNRRDIAHSCGEVCGKALSKNNCVHKCTLLCHPGSCPLCIAMVTKFCGCGKMSQTLQCSTHTLLLCDDICDKKLNCGLHKCEKNCHHGECERCEHRIEQECYCGKNKRDVTCQNNVSFTYSCGGLCRKLLNCGNHTCKKICHQEDCEPCSLTPDKVMFCCCGQTPLTERRENCLDPIPTCDKICSKNLTCGQPNNPHTCKAKCHQEDCPECDLTTGVKCRCGNMNREIACEDLTTKADDARCEKRCTKKRLCGKHKCNQPCCIDIEHICPLSCSKTLSCGKHKCEQSCHKGRCPPCWRSSFEELYCECGAAVIYPPVPCGRRRPTCDRPCSREHACGHEVLHNCHSEPNCPPCTVLTQRWCHGKHELRKAVACYVTEISCGLPCNKPLSCGRHKCVTTCHAGPCEKPGQECSQPCTTPKEICGHICGAPCHENICSCPDFPCREMVKVTCQCGHRTMSRVCAENSKEYQRIASSILASKMADMQLGLSINLEEVFGQGAKKQNQLKTLECNDECRIIERNRRLALGLQIVNPDLSGKLMPRYSDLMKQWAKKDPYFCQTTHDKLTELVRLAKASKQKSRSYSFDNMNREKRQFTHEYCKHFGCESHAYDQEPKRNVVATALKDKCWLPSYSLLEIVQRENGQRRVPGPMLSTSRADGSVKTILSLPMRKGQKSSAPSRIPEPEIDYFDYQG